jgi:hypothetical protein
MTDVEPAEDVDTGTAEKDERATGTGVLDVGQYGGVGYITDDGIVAGVFWWNDPTYPANGDAVEVYQAQLEAGQAEEDRRQAAASEQPELEPA